MPLAYYICVPLLFLLVLSLCLLSDSSVPRAHALNQIPSAPGVTILPDTIRQTEQPISSFPATNETSTCVPVHSAKHRHLLSSRQELQKVVLLHHNLSRYVPAIRHLQLYLPIMC